MTEHSRRLPLAWLRAGALMLGLVASSPWAAPKEAAAPAPAASAASAPASRATLASIVEASAEQDAFEASIRHHLPHVTRVNEVRSAISMQEQDFAALDTPVERGETDLSERLDVFDRIARLRSLQGRIDENVRQVAQWSDRLDADLDRLQQRDAEVAGWLAVARERQAPTALITQLEGLPARHAELLEHLRSSRDTAVLVLGEVVTLRNQVAARLVDLENRGAAIESRLRAAHGEPLWQVGTHLGGDLRSSLRFAAAEMGLVMTYVNSHAAVLVWIALGTLALAWLVLYAARRHLADSGGDVAARRTQALFGQPLTVALALALFAAALFGPRAPLLFYPLLWAALSVPVALLVRHVLESEARLSLYTIVAVIAMIAALDPVIGPLALLGRWLHLLQYVAVAAALALDLRRGHCLLGSEFQPAMGRRLTQVLIAVLLLAVLASVAGNVGLARSLGHGAIGALGFWLVLVVVAHLLYGLGVALLRSAPAQRLRVVASEGETLRRVWRQLLIWAVMLAWATGMLTLLGLSTSLVTNVQGLLDSELAIGEVTLSTDHIVSGLLVLVGTLLLVKVVRLVLEVEILPRLVRRRGVAFALSALVRYALLTAGLLLALAAMGIDMTKVTVLAGALGVGIGFGLQSVVNNFLSGLILLVERPVTAGDVVQIGDVQGVVAGIGVRSTTVRTPAGAEVIVPNADLITKVVSNWTLSDSRCRLEIEVNVPSAVDPDRAIAMLESAAAEVPEVAPRPAPRAWLSGLRDGQRSYRLHAWVANYDAQLEVQSAVRLRIARRFEQEGVALP